MKAFVMVGAPGSGKSTYVSHLKEQFPDLVVVSGDNIREELYGDADIQGVYLDIEKRMKELISENKGKTIVMDGTHYIAKYRKRARIMLKSFGYKEVTAVVINQPLEVCLQQNSERERKVPYEVIERMHTKLQASLPGIHSEGFSEVLVFS